MVLLLWAWRPVFLAVWNPFPRQNSAREILGIFLIYSYGWSVRIGRGHTSLNDDLVSRHSTRTTEKIDSVHSFPNCVCLAMNKASDATRFFVLPTKLSVRKAPVELFLLTEVLVEVLCRACAPSCFLWQIFSPFFFSLPCLAVHAMVCSPNPFQ